MNEATIKLYKIFEQIGILDKNKEYSKVELVLDVNEGPTLSTTEVLLKYDEIGNMYADYVDSICRLGVTDEES